MAKRPDTPCAGCGKLLWSGRAALPAGQRTCRSCRRARSTKPIHPRNPSGDCATCGGPLSAQGKIYCSRQCANGRPERILAKLSKTEASRRRYQAKRARKLRIEREPYTLADIAKRDRYRCGLCRKRVAMTKAVPHPKAPTIDHILPIACGGNDTRANVQLAHFICNSRKGTRGSQQLALAG